VLVAGHGPFAWGRSPAEAVETAVVLEQVAKTAFGSLLLDPRLRPLDRHILDKHFQRKHGPDAYYGQKKEKDR
jgi:L-ribulose-5-phosphate 4-epimerase